MSTPSLGDAHAHERQQQQSMGDHRLQRPSLGEADRLYRDHGEVEHQEAADRQAADLVVAVERGK
jgi:hypothetical protein